MSSPLTPLATHVWPLQTCDIGVGVVPMVPDVRGGARSAFRQVVCEDLERKAVQAEECRSTVALIACQCERMSMGCTILVADEDSLLKERITNALEIQGFQVLTTVDGPSALEIALCLTSDLPVMVPLSVAEIRQLFFHLVSKPSFSFAYHLAWSCWRRAHQTFARLCQDIR